MTAIIHYIFSILIDLLEYYLISYILLFKKQKKVFINKKNVDKLIYHQQHVS
jgi:hypothetical protein